MTSKKLHAVLALLFASVAFAVMPLAAQASEPHWYVCQKEATKTHQYSDAGCKNKKTGEYELIRLPFTGAKTEVTTSGTVTFTDEKLFAPTVTLVVCATKDAGKIWNTSLAEPGQGEVTEVVNKCTATVNGAKCEAASLTAQELPWATKLREVAVAEYRDIITVKRYVLTLKACPVLGNYEVPYEGQLKPKLVLGIPSQFEFNAAAGSLTSGAGTEGEFDGKESLESTTGQELVVKTP